MGPRLLGATLPSAPLGLDGQRRRRLRHAGSCQLARVRQVLVDDPGAVIAETRSAADKRSRRFQTELKVAMGAGASSPNLRELEAVPSRSGTTLRLQGTYTVPLGTIGHLRPRTSRELGARVRAEDDVLDIEVRACGVPSPAHPRVDT